jgi:ribosomal protein L11 methyltransferase
VLGIAAAKLGWSPVTGCDRELASLETARANAEANGIEMSIERVDVREGPPPVEPSVVANLTGNLLRDCAGHLAAAGEAPNTLVCSGMLETEIDDVVAAFAPTGLAESGRRVENSWGALLLRSEA